MSGQFVEQMSAGCGDEFKFLILWYSDNNLISYLIVLLKLNFIELPFNVITSEPGWRRRDYKVPETPKIEWIYSLLQDVQIKVFQDPALDHLS